MITFGHILILIVVVDFVVWTYNVLFSFTLENGERVHFSIGTHLALLAYYVVHLLVNLFLNYYGGKKNIDKEKRVSIIRLTLFIQFGVGLISIGLLSFSWMNQEQCKNVVIYYIFRFIVIIFMMLLSGDLAATAQVANVNSGGAGATAQVANVNSSGARVIPLTRLQPHHALKFSRFGGAGATAQVANVNSSGDGIIPLTRTQSHHAPAPPGFGGAGAIRAFQPQSQPASSFSGFSGFNGTGATVAFQPQHQYAPSSFLGFNGTDARLVFHPQYQSATPFLGFSGAGTTLAPQSHPQQRGGKLKTKPQQRGGTKPQQRGGKLKTK